MLVDLLLAFGVLLLGGAVYIRHLIEQKDTRFSKSRFWKRMRIVPVLLTILAFSVQFAAGRIEMREKQTELDGLRMQLMRIAANVEALVVNGTLSPEDAKRILVKL